MASPTGKQRRALTLARLEEIYFTSGFKAASEAFQGLIEPRRDWSVMKTGEGAGAHRTDLKRDASITYEDYSPPGLWQPTFAVLLATVSPGQRTGYVSHEGEELVVPIERKIQFHYFWSPGGEEPMPVKEKEIEPGALLRVNPSVPHHASGLGGPAKAWLIIRHSSHTEGAISLDRRATETKAAKLHEEATGLTAKELKQPGRYALIAWGLAAKLRNYRERSNLRVSEVAEACGIDHTHLSRIENGATNISLDALLRLARYLRVDIGEFFTSDPWRSSIDYLPPGTVKGEPVRRRCPPPPTTHYLHASWVVVPSRKRFTFRRTAEASRTMATYIVLSGRLIASFAPGDELLTAGSVMHLRGRQDATVEALDDCTLLEVVYSHVPPKD